MQEKGRGFQNWGYVALGAAAFALFYFIKSLKGEDFVKLALGKKSDVVLTAMGAGIASPRILSHTGKIVSKKFDAGKPGPKQDSLTFRLVLKGEKATATIRTKIIKQPSGEWKVVKSDTTYTN